MMYDLPKSLDVCGVTYDIRSDFRAVLDCCAALSDVDLTDDEKAIVVLDIMYPSFEEMPPEHYEEAIKQCFWFINCGAEDGATQNAPKLVDWEQDFQYIVAPINHVVGREVRAIDYLHWWSFISAYYEIGDCTFAQIVRIRDKKAKGKPLSKQDKEWYKQNRHLVDFKKVYSSKEKETMKAWGV